MTKNKKPKDLDIPDYQIESLARVLLPIIQDYLNSEQGQKDFDEWQKNKQLNNMNYCKSGCIKKDNKENG